LAFSPDGQVLVTGPFGGKLRFWSIPDGTPLASYNDETGIVSSIAYSPDGKFIYYGRNYYDGTLCCMLNPYRNAVFPTRGGNTGFVTARIITPDTFPITDYTNVTLRDGVHPEISVNAARVNDHVLSMRFDLRGAAIG